MAKRGHLYIDIHNDPDILQTIIDSIPYLPNGWEADTSAFPGNGHWNNYPNKTARFFVFHVGDKRSNWAFYDTDAVSHVNMYLIRDVAHVSKLMDKIYELEQSEEGGATYLPIGGEV